MPKIATMRSERIDIRTNAEIKAVIERAAQLRHTSISAYLLDTALEKAKAELHAVETIKLRDADRDLFFTALESPPEPNAALKRLFSEGRRRKA